jgi:t-SNARE complex subunit (syntaxin)
MTTLKKSLIQNIVESPLHEHSMQVVDHNPNVIEERVVAINNLERGVREVGELFGDMALLVNNQGENIDNIETNIQNTHVSIDQARDQLVRASQYQRRHRKCYIKCICLTIGVLTILIIVLAVILPKN